MNIQTAQDLMRSIIKEAKVPQYKQKQFHAALAVLTTTKEPDPAQLPEEVEKAKQTVEPFLSAACEFSRVPFADAIRVFLAHITAQAQRLVEVESALAGQVEVYAELGTRTQRYIERMTAAEARVKDSEAILAQICEAVGPMEEGEPCPACHTYSHKGWCWYPALVEWDKARAARAAGGAS